MLSRLWMKPKNTDITGWDETQERRYNCLTTCSTCPGSCMPSLITTGQCQKHLGRGYSQADCWVFRGTGLCHFLLYDNNNANKTVVLYFMFDISKRFTGIQLKMWLIVLDTFSLSNPFCCSLLLNVKSVMSITPKPCVLCPALSNICKPLQCSTLPTMDTSSDLSHWNTSSLISVELHYV